MKKTMVILAVMLVALTAKETIAKETTKIEGVYTLITVDGSKIPGTVSHGGHDMMLYSGVFTINADGTCVSQTVFGVSSGEKITRQVNATYTQEGSTLNMRWEGAGTTTGAIEGETFTMNNEGMIFSYTKQSVSPPEAAIEETVVSREGINGDFEDGTYVTDQGATMPLLWQGGGEGSFNYENDGTNGYIVLSNTDSSWVVAHTSKPPILLSDLGINTSRTVGFNADIIKLDGDGTVSLKLEEYKNGGATANGISSKQISPTDSWTTYEADFMIKPDTDSVILVLVVDNQGASYGFDNVTFASIDEQDPELGKSVLINEYLSNGKYEEGIEVYSTRVSLEATSQDVFSLGTLQFLHGLEQLTQSMYDMGLKSQMGQELGVPFVRLPVPVNPDPRQITGNDVRQMFETFEQSMKTVNTTLSQIPEEEFKVRINLGQIKMDFNGDGKVTEEEKFHTAYTVFNPRAAGLLQQNEAFPITFDLADAFWLKGYSHLLMTLCDLILAHDGSELFKYTGQLFFENPKTPYKDFFIDADNSFGKYADAIAFIHLLRLPVIEPKRYQSARTHLIGMIECSRMSWKYINQEKDNDFEWIPNAEQQSATGMTIADETIDGWMTFLNELEQILDGRKRVVHWRTGNEKGINIKKVFEQPAPVFDLVLWIQGSAAMPYLEDGPVSEPQTWNQMMSLFRGNFIGFMIWVN